MSTAEIFDWIGYISTGIVVITTFTGLVLWFMGVIPSLWRLGYGLSKRKIAVFSGVETFASLKSILTHSGLFDEENIIPIHGEKDLGSADSTSVYLAYWRDCKDWLDEILEKRHDSVPFIIYVPPEDGRIPEAVMQKLEVHRHTAVTNFRGRLLNDIVTAMITTSYEKRRN
jgi:hypothetical protein